MPSPHSHLTTLNMYLKYLHMSHNSQFTLMVHVLTLLAGAEKPVSSSHIAGSVNTNPVLIRQIIGQLRDAGLVKTLPGSMGGAKLGRDSTDITRGDVYQVVKSETLFGLHAKPPNPYCPVGRNIQAVLVEIFDEMDVLLASGLTKTSIADMLARVAVKESDKNG